jgi:hypothetical protein
VAAATTATEEDVAAAGAFMAAADSAGAAVAETCGCGSEIRMLDSDSLKGLSEYKTFEELQNAPSSHIRATLLQTLGGTREISDALQLFALQVCSTCMHIFLPAIRFLPCLLFDCVI